MRTWRLDCNSMAKDCIRLAGRNIRHIKLAWFCTGLRAHELEKAYINKMLHMNYKQLTNFEWALLIGFTPKRDRSSRFWIEYRKVNEVTGKDAKHFLWIEDYLESLGTARVISTHEASIGYKEIDIDDGNKDKTTCTSHCGLSRFLRMPVWPGARAENVLKSNWQYTANYNMAISTHVPKRSLQVFLVYENEPGRPRNCTVTAVESLSIIETEELLFPWETYPLLGSSLEICKLTISPNAIDTTRRLQQPTNVAERKSILGLCNVFCRFVQNMAGIVELLNRRLENDHPFHFGRLNKTKVEARVTLQNRLLSL